MDEIEVQIWRIEGPDSSAGAVVFPVAVHGINLSYAVKYTGNQDVFASVYDPSGARITTMPMMLPPLERGQRAEGELTFALRIERPGRYAVVAEIDGQRIAETSFHIRQYPSIDRE